MDPSREDPPERPGQTRPYAREPLVTQEPARDRLAGGPLHDEVRSADRARAVAVVDQLGHRYAAARRDRQHRGLARHLRVRRRHRRVAPQDQRSPVRVERPGLPARTTREPPEPGHLHGRAVHRRQPCREVSGERGGHDRLAVAYARRGSLVRESAYSSIRVIMPSSTVTNRQAATSIAVPSGRPPRSTCRWT